MLQLSLISCACYGAGTGEPELLQQHVDVSLERHRLITVIVPGIFSERVRSFSWDIGMEWLDIVIDVVPARTVHLNLANGIFTRVAHKSLKLAGELCSNGTAADMALAQLLVDSDIRRELCYDANEGHFRFVQLAQKRPVARLQLSHSCA